MRKSPPVSIADALFLIGLASVGYGLWRWSPPLMFVVVGAVLAAFGLVLGRR